MTNEKPKPGEFFEEVKHNLTDILTEFELTANEELFQDLLNELIGFITYVSKESYRNGIETEKNRSKKSNSKKYVPKYKRDQRKR